jgi:small subunit ribosomal protein S20
MPNKPAAKKALRQTLKRTPINSALKDELKRALKTARRIKDVKSAESVALLRQTVKLIDKSVRKRVLKKNTASRAKSRLVKLWNKKTS